MTFTATMNENTASSGAMGMSRVCERSFDLGLPDSSACALVSSRMIRKRIREATAAAPKLAARNVDVTVTTVVIRGIPLRLKAHGARLYLRLFPTRRFFESEKERPSDGGAYRRRGSSRPPTSA